MPVAAAGRHGWGRYTRRRGCRRAPSGCHRTDQADRRYRRRAARG